MGKKKRIFKLLASDRDNEYMMIDATIVRAHQHSDGQRGDLTAGLLYRGRKPPGCRSPMRLIQDSLGWLSIDSAPLDKDVALLVTDGPSEPYPLKLPCRLTAAGWVSSSRGTPLAVTPVKWKPYTPPATSPTCPKKKMTPGRFACPTSC